MLAEHHFSGQERKFAQEWLEGQDSVAARSEIETDRDISRRANRISLWVGISANIIALAALGVASYAAIKG